MKQMKLQLIEMKQQKPDESPHIITLFHTNESLEGLLRHMLQDAYQAGFTEGKGESALQNQSHLVLRNHFYEFYITYVDRDLKSTAQDFKPIRDDYYNTLLDLITKHEQMQWYSGFHEGCACVTHEKRAQ